MTEFALLNWAMLALSRVNAILMAWLGLTVLLNSERRWDWGVWVAGCALLTGAIFFGAHAGFWGVEFPLTELLRQNPTIGWYFAWAAITWLPILWYLVTLWYGGFWERPALLYRRHRFGLPIALLGGLILLILNFRAPIPATYEQAGIASANAPYIRSYFWLYPPFLILLQVLALDAIWHPDQSSRSMLHQARQRAHPWLVGTSLCMLVASLLVSWLFWLILFWVPPSQMIEALALVGFDSSLSIVILLAVLCLGQALVRYEIFTSKPFPRAGLRRQWNRAVILAFGYSSLMSAATLWLPTVFATLLGTVLLVSFYVLVSWRITSEREQHQSQLRASIAQPRTESLTPGGETDTRWRFVRLVEEILQTRQAHLLPMGRFAPLLSSTPFNYPQNASLDEATLAVLNQKVSGLTNDTLCIALNRAEFGRLEWLLPLWDSQGLAGLLLFGDSSTGTLHPMETLEIARASAEQLLQTQAQLEFTQRLIQIQRQRLAETRVLDQQTRRTLHDEILPELHSAILALSASNKIETLTPLVATHQALARLLRAMPHPTQIKPGNGNLTTQLRENIQQEFGADFQKIEWQNDVGTLNAYAHLTDVQNEALFHAAREVIRNAARYGRGSQAQYPLQLQVRWQETAQLVRLLIHDNGVGFNHPARSPMSSGQGLALHSTLLAILGGELRILPSEQGTTVALEMPLSSLPEINAG